MPRARGLLSFVLLVASLALATPARAAEGEPRDQIVLSGDVVVARGEEVGEVVMLSGTVTVEGVVLGDVVVVDGQVVISGQVSGSVVSLNGPVVLTRTAQVGGDVLAPDRLKVASGARVAGSVRRGVSFTLHRPVVALFGRFAAPAAVAVSTLALGLALLLIAPRGVDAVARAAREAPWAAVGWGLVLVLALPVVGVLAVLSLLGLPFGLPLLAALALVLSVGFALGVFALGRLWWREPGGRPLALLIGWAIVSVVSAIPFVGAILWGAGAVAGLGAATVAVWRARGVPGRHRPGAVAGPEEETGT